MKKPKRSHSEIDYWQSNTDLMTGLVLTLMLIIMLLILYLMQIPQFDDPYTQLGDNYAMDNETGDSERNPNDIDMDSMGVGGDEGGDDRDEYRGDDEDYHEDGDDDYDGAGGGGSGTGYGTDPEYQYEYPLPTHNGDETKAAVYTTVIDAETGRAIRVAGITFELYEEQHEGDGGALRFLNTYYPEKIEYRNYETTDEGVFFLPEKVEEGYFYLKQITPLEGYDMAEQVHFDVDQEYDWPDPYVVSVELSPAKNIIPIVIEDSETHAPLLDGTFAVHAAEDVLTADNTLRYANGELADTVTFGDEEFEPGYGQSKALYLGLYTVSQDVIPRYYAGITYTEDVEVIQKSQGTPPTLKFTCEKTRIKVNLVDELYTNVPLEGAEFTLTCDDYPEFNQTAVTDENGSVVFTNLEKNKLYRLNQTGSVGDYRFRSSETEITVDTKGRINEEAEILLERTNYIPRVSVSVKEMLFGKPVSNANLVLYNEKNEKIRTWTSSAEGEIFENLPGGKYYVLYGGDKSKRYDFEFSDEKAMQECVISLWTMQNVVVAVLGALIILLGVASVIFVVTGKRKKNG